MLKYWMRLANKTSTKKKTVKLDFDIFLGVAMPILSSIPAIQTRVETLKIETFVLTPALPPQTPSSATFSTSAVEDLAV